MKRIASIAASTMLALAFARAPSIAGAQQSRSRITPDLHKLLIQIRAADTDKLSVSEEDGRLLRVLAASSGAKRALEIGTAFGYSAIWIGLGLSENGGHLTTIEFDAARARLAADNIRRAGLSDIVTVVAGDGFQEIPKLRGEFDFVFLDAWKRDYKRFFDLMLPRLTLHGLLLAHNVVNKRTEMPDFLDAIEHNPAVLTTIVKPGTEGMSISCRIK